MSNLTVYWDQRIVGTISRHPKGKITFQYTAEWLENTGRQISLSLPCREERFPPGVSTAFFENLFPESEARTILARLSHTCVFDLLAVNSHMPTFKSCL